MSEMREGTATAYKALVDARDLVQGDARQFISKGDVNFDLSYCYARSRARLVILQSASPKNMTTWYSQIIDSLDTVHMTAGGRARETFKKVLLKMSKNGYSE